MEIGLIMMLTGSFGLFFMVVYLVIRLNKAEKKLKEYNDHARRSQEQSMSRRNLGGLGEIRKI